MGVIKGVFLILVTALLFLAFLSLNLTLSISSSLQYDNVEKQAGTFATDTLKQAGVTDAIKQSLPELQAYCLKNHSEYIFNYQQYSFSIPCAVVFQGENAIISEAAKSIINNIYYTRYDCSFIDCFKKYSNPLPLFLISEKAYYFWSDNVFFALIASIVLFILLFFFVEKKTNGFILSGILLIASSLLFVKLDFILSLINEKTIFQLLWIFFSQSYFVSIKVLFVGAGLLAFGILLDIFKAGIFFSHLISRFKGKIQEKAEERAEKKAAKKAVKEVKRKSKKSK